ncbi:MAG: sigma-70 family RNA polymerase sigma factor [Coriobacteriia bacterium]|nr:sigma-70 family RNA polymerase sigma factor [Coriobacteriia bacterium]
MSACREVDLVRRAQKGSQQALAELYQHYYPQFYHFARKRLPSDDQAIDCVQSAFLYAIVHIKELHNPNSFRAWLYRICSSEISAVYKLKKRDNTMVSLDEMTTEQIGAYKELLITAESSQKPRDLVVRQDVLLECLKHLTENQKNIIIMRYYGGLKLVEIAEVLDISQETARKRLHDALAALRKNCEFFSPEIFLTND